MTAAAMVKAENVHKSFGHVKVPGHRSGGRSQGRVLLARTVRVRQVDLPAVYNYLNIDAAGLLLTSAPCRLSPARRQAVRTARVEVAAHRRDIGMVFQRFNLFPHMTALENVMEAPVRVKKEPKAVVRERALKLLDRVGLADKANSYPAQLSGGQQQRGGDLALWRCSRS